MHKLITDHIDVDELQARYEESLLTGDEETQRVYRRIQELDMMLNEGIRFKIISGMDFCYIRSVWCSIGSPHGGLLQPTFRSTSIWPFIPTAILLDDTYLSYKLAQTNIQYKGPDMSRSTPDSQKMTVLLIQKSYNYILDTLKGYTNQDPAMFRPYSHTYYGTLVDDCPTARRNSFLGRLEEPYIRGMLNEQTSHIDATNLVLMLGISGEELVSLLETNGQNFIKYLFEWLPYSYTAHNKFVQSVYEFESNGAKLHWYRAGNTKRGSVLRLLMIDYASFLKLKLDIIENLMRNLAELVVSYTNVVIAFDLYDNNLDTA